MHESSPYRPPRSPLVGRVQLPTRHLAVVRTIAASEAIGAASLLAISSLQGIGRLHPVIVAFLILMICSGVLLWQGRRVGILLSIGLQLAQLVVAVNDFFSTVIWIPAFLGPMLHGGTLAVRVMLGPSAVIAGRSEPPEVTVGINVLALGATWFLASLLSQPPVSGAPSDQSAPQSGAA